MQRILLLLAGVAFLALPTASVARAQNHQQHLGAGFLVVHNALTDGGVTGPSVVTVVVRGFVLGQIAQEGAVELYHVDPGTNSAAAQVGGADVSRRLVTFGDLQGTEFTGSGFRFRAVGGVWRVVVYGSGISLYAGGEVRVITLHGSVEYPGEDGKYSIDGGPFASLPSGVITRRLEAK